MKIKKTDEYEEFLNDFAEKVFGRPRTIIQCAICGSDKVTPECFRDEISRKEFEISRMCQQCQDGVFPPED